MNSFAESKYSGLQVYFSKNNSESEKLANLIQKNVREKCQNENERQIKPGSDMYVLKNVENPAVLIECGFISNPEECAKLSQKEFINHLARFIANIWQTHAFCEGNTRTTAVFLIKYLNSIGYKINSDVFYKNSWYFRNALVRANYSNYMLGIQETTYYLELLLENLLFNTNHTLSNEVMHIYYNE